MVETTRDLWRLADSVAEQPTPGGTRRKARPWTLQAVPVLLLTTLLGLLLTIPRDLGMEARVALFAFGIAVIFWSLTNVSAAYVALGALLLAVLGGAVKQDELYGALGSDVIWLMIGAFVLGAATRAAGLADRLTRVVAIRARTVDQMLWLTTLTLLPLAFLIPSTSARAAVALPVFRSLSEAARDPGVTRALALLIPTVILVSTIMSLIGTGSHLIADDLLDKVAGQRIGFVQWMVYGAPFGVAASLATTFAIGRLFLDRAQRSRPLTPLATVAGPFSRDEKRVLLVVVVLAGLWLTEPLHTLKVAFVSMLGAFALMLPGLGVLSWKEGLKSVSWNLVVFMGAALELGEALIESGAAKWLVTGLFSLTGLSDGGSTLVVLLAVILITLTSHVYLTSRMARAAALIPPLLYLAVSLKLNPAAMMFIGTVGLNYCLTFPVSSTALLLFGELDRETWRPADLMKLSAVVLPAHAVLMVAFYYGWWRHVGLAF